MAITWGGWAARDAYYKQRVGIDLTRSGRTFTARYYVETTGSMYYNGYTLNRGGNITGGVSFNWNTGSASTMLVNTATFTGSPGGSYTFTASVHLFWGGTMSVSRSGSIPISSPGAPTSVTAKRITDNRADLTWNYGSNVAAVAVERWSYNDPKWRRVATLNPAKKAWSDTGIKPNDRYEYRVRTGNPSGDSAWVGASRFSTTPAAPSNVIATKNADGSITVTWKSNAPYEGSGFQIYDNGTQVGSVPADTLTWTHATPPPSAAHTYTVTMTEDDPALTSAQSAPSNTVQLLAAPNAPTSLSPNGTTIAFEVPNFPLTWAHNPVDSSAQTSAQYRFREQGTTTWNTGSVTTDQFVEVSPAMFTTGTVYEWQARTRGAYRPSDEAGFSPWSALATLTLMNTPGVSISTPESGSTVNVSRMTAMWNYFQAQGRGQAGAEVQLVQDPDGDSPITRESRTVSGAATSLLLNAALADQTTYMIRVRARSGDGLWSSWDESTFTVSYPQPPVPEPTVTWDDTQGAAQVSVFNPEPIDPQPAAVTNIVERSIDGGNTWELVMDDLPVNGTLTDPECLSYGTTLYRVTAVSALPSSAVSEIEELYATSLDIWLNGGDGFAVAAPITCKPGLTVKPGLLEKNVYYFAGQETGTSVSGKARQRIYSLKGSIHEDDDDTTDVRQILEEVMPFLPDPFLVRDFAGHRIYASVSDLQVEWEAWRTYSVSFEAEVIHRGDS